MGGYVLLGAARAPGPQVFTTAPSRLVTVARKLKGGPRARSAPAAAAPGACLTQCMPAAIRKVRFGMSLRPAPGGGPAACAAPPLTLRMGCRS